MNKYIVIIAAVLLSGCGTTLTREPDQGITARDYSTYRMDDTTLHNVRVVTKTSTTQWRPSYCSGRPISTPGMRRRCGL